MGCMDVFKFDINGPLANISSTFFDLPLKLRVVYLKNKQTNSVTNMEFYQHAQYCFCCYVIKSAGEAANNVLLSVVWNPLLIEINLSQIMTLDIKREKVCAVCPYLLCFLKQDCFCLFENTWDYGVSEHSCRYICDCILSNFVFYSTNKNAVWTRGIINNNIMYCISNFFSSGRYQIFHWLVFVEIQKIWQDIEVAHNYSEYELISKVI